MKTLWAPWRMEFITGNKPEGCIFCVFPAQDRDKDNLIVGRTARSFAILNRFPYNSGHLMVIPRRHTADFAGLPQDEFDDMQRLLRVAVEAVAEAYQPHAFNVGMNLGRAAGAGIADHLHWHVVPRWDGDTNYMPVLGETKVMVEHLTATWEKLSPIFGRRLAR